MASWSNYHTNNENEEKERQRNHFNVVFYKLALGKKYFSIDFKNGGKKKATATYSATFK